MSTKATGRAAVDIERPSNKNYQSSYSYGWNSWNPNESPFYYYTRQSTSQAKADDDAADMNVHIIRVVFFVTLAGTRGEGARRLSSPVTFGHVQPGQRFLAFHREAERRTGEAAHPMEPESYTERASWRGRCRKTLPTRFWELALEAGISKLWTAYHSE
ncbi:hypothetical protein D917_06169 [Trichinella nativa]|uniref:Uncharacterized protein n=1 Tax=Trichinella nativa TaxID=6335 RepID=A0A1Y3EXB3_9BILA|nr:hypothetical protein D917_06169 [Trichinella nativa]